MPEGNNDISFATKVVALIRSAGLDPESMDINDFSVRAPWIFYTAWMSFHPELKRTRTLKFFGDFASNGADNSHSDQISNESRVREVLDNIQTLYTSLIRQAEEFAAAIDPTRPITASAASTRSTPNLLEPVLKTSGSKASLHSEQFVQLQRTLKCAQDISVRDVCTGEPHALGMMVTILFQEGQRLWAAATPSPNHLPGANNSAKRFTRPKSANGSTRASSASRIAYLVPAPIPGVPTKREIVELKKKQQDEEINKPKPDNGRTCDVPSNPYIRHLTVEPPPKDLTIQSNVNRMKLRIDIIKNMRANSPIRPTSAPSAATGTTMDITQNGWPSSAARSSSVVGSNMEAFPLGENGATPSPIVSPRKLTGTTNLLGGPVPDLNYTERQHGFGAFLLEKLRRKAKGRTALDDAKEDQAAKKKKKKSKRKKSIKKRGATSDVAEAVALLAPSMLQKIAYEEHAAKHQEALKKAQEELLHVKNGSVQAALLAKKKAEGPGRMTIMENAIKGGVFKPGQAIKNETTMRQKFSNTWMGETEPLHENSSEVLEDKEEPEENADVDSHAGSVEVLGGCVGEVVEKSHMVGGQLAQQWRHERRRARPGSAPAKRSSIFDRLFAESLLLPPEAEVLNPDFLRSLGIDETHDLFINATGTKPVTNRSSAPLPVTVNGEPALLTYDLKSGHKKYITAEQHKAREAAWKAANAAPSEEELPHLLAQIDKVWSMPMALQAPEPIRSEPTRAQWPGFNTGQRTAAWVQRARKEVLTEKFSHIGGKQSAHTTNHALSHFASMTAKLIGDAQATQDFYSLSSQLQPLDLLITIEHCHSCGLHDMTSKHDARQYVTMAHAFLRHLVAVAHAEQVCCRVGVSRFPSVLLTSGDDGETHSRIGSFEIQVIYHAPASMKGPGKGINEGIVSEILHSKLSSQRWPAKSVVEKRFKAFLNRFHVPVRDPRLATETLSASAELQSGSDGLAAYPMGLLVPLSSVQVVTEDWVFAASPSVAPVEQRMHASPTERAEIRSNNYKQAERFRQEQVQQEEYDLANELAQRKQELRNRDEQLSASSGLRGSSSKMVQNSNNATKVTTSGDPRMLSVPKSPGGGARSYISGSPSHVRSLSRSPSPTHALLSGAANKADLVTSHAHPAMESRDLQVQWAYDCRIAARARVFAPGDTVYVCGVRHPRGGTERHALPGTVVVVHNTIGSDSSVGAARRLTVRLKYHETTIDVSSEECDLLRETDRAYAREIVPDELGLLMHLLAAGKPIWKVLHAGDLASADSSTVFLTRASFFHQLRNAASQAEAAARAKNASFAVEHPLTGVFLDLQMSYSEATLNWVFNAAGELVDTAALEQLCQAQYLRRQNELLLSQQPTSEGVPESKDSDDSVRIHDKSEKPPALTISPKAQLQLLPTQSPRAADAAGSPRPRLLSPRALAQAEINKNVPATISLQQKKPEPEPEPEQYELDEWDLPTPVKANQAAQENQLSVSATSVDLLTAVSSSTASQAKDASSVDSNRTAAARHDSAMDRYLDKTMASPRISDTANTIAAASLLTRALSATATASAVAAATLSAQKKLSSPMHIRGYDVEPTLEPAEATPRLVTAENAFESSVTRLDQSQTSQLSEASRPLVETEKEAAPALSQVSISLSNYLATGASSSDDEMNNDQMLALLGHKSPSSSNINDNIDAHADTKAIGEEKAQIKASNHVQIVRETIAQTARSVSPASSEDSDHGQRGPNQETKENPIALRKLDFEAEADEEYGDDWD